jgi:D-threo-aldose 1-dehydrogenase
MTLPWLRPLGNTNLIVSAVSAGGGPLGSMPGNFGRDVPPEEGIATVARIFDGPINFLDTSNGYSAGESERRIGAALAARGGLPEGFVLATKVDRDAGNDFSARRVRQSLEESLKRLGLSRVQLLHLHDPEFALTFEQAMAPGGPVEELERIKAEGLAAHIGIAGGVIGLMRRFVETGVFDVLLTHNRYSLADRSANDTIDSARARGVAVLNAAVMGGGILALGTGRSDKYAYRKAPEATLAGIREMEKVCAAYNVPLAAAALQFSLRDERIASTIVGFSRPERVDETVRLAQWPIPESLWPEIEKHVPPSDNWLW